MRTFVSFFFTVTCLLLYSVGAYSQYFAYKYDPRVTTVTDFVFDISGKITYPTGGTSANSTFTLSGTSLLNGTLTQQLPGYLINFSPKTVGGRVDSILNNILFSVDCDVTYNNTTVTNKLSFAIINTSQGMGMEILDPSKCYTGVDDVQFIPNIKFNSNSTIGNNKVHGLTTPLVGDLNGDGKPEVVVTGMPSSIYQRTDKIYILNGQTGEALSTITFPAFAMQDNNTPVGSSASGQTGWHPSAGRIALIDADRNGKGEIIIAWGYNTSDSKHKRIVCYEVDDPNTFTFREKWVSDIQYDAYGAAFATNYDGNYGMQRPLVQVVDIDEDGVPEIMVYNKIYNSLTGKLIAITQDMEPVSNYLKNTPVDYEAYAYLGRERVSGRGKLANGTSVGGGLDGSGDIAHAFPYIYDLDGDGKMEIIAGGKIYYDVDFSRGITNAFKVKSLYGDYGLDVGDGYTSVADINADGKAEVVVVMNDYNLAYAGLTSPLAPQNNLRIIVYDPGFLKKSGDKWIPSQETPVILAETRVIASRLGANQGTHSYVFVADIDGLVQNNKKFPEISILGGTYLAGGAIPAHPNVSSIPTSSGGFPATYVADGGASGVLMSWTWDDNASGVADRLKVSFIMEHRDNSLNTGFSLFDFDDDGIQDICYRDERELRILSPTIPFASLKNIASVTPDYGIKKFTSIMGTYTGYEYPVIADTDGDGSADITVTNAGGVLFPANLNVIQADPTKTKFTTAPKVWNQYMYHPLKINEDLTTPLVNLNPLDPSFSYITDTSNLDLYTQVYNNTLTQVVKYTVFQEELDNGTSVNMYRVYKTVQPGPNAKVVKAFINTDSKIQITLTNTGDATLNSLAPIVVYDGNPVNGNIRGTIALPQDLFVGDTINIVSDFTVPLNIIMTVRVADASEKVGGVFVDKFTQIYKDCDWRNNVARVATELILFNDTIIAPAGKIVIYPFENDILPSDKCDSSNVKIISGIFNGQTVNGPSIGSAQIHSEQHDAVSYTDSIVYTISQTLLTQRDSFLYEVTCWESDRSKFTKDTAIVIIIIHPKLNAVYDRFHFMENMPMTKLDLSANDNIPSTCETLTVGIKPEDAPSLSTAVINTNNLLEYTPKPNATGIDIFRYYITCSRNPTDTAYAKVHVQLFKYPELILLDSCSVRPKLALTLHYTDYSYEWEYSSDGSTWANIKSGIDVMISANKGGFYRVKAIDETGLAHKIPTGVKLTVEKTTVNNLVWYNVSSIKVPNIWVTN